MVDRNALWRTFHDLHGSEPRLFAAPGRVNLIGEHTDYNDGFVLPAAIDRDTLVAATPRGDRIIMVRSMTKGETRTIDLDAPPSSSGGDWGNYIEGMARVLEAQGMEIRGADMVIDSDLPAGSGLSSSAALEIAVGLALLALSGHEADMVRLALAGQKAEHIYAGTKCGIMDQLVAALGREHHALLIDCRSLEITPIGIDTTDVALVICDTGVRHELASSEYNTRRAECEEGVRILRQVLPDIRSLRDVSAEELERFRTILPETIRKRCAHVVSENMRTLQAAGRLQSENFDRVGELMAASHRSLRDDYEVSCAELDLMVDLANEVEGTIGARMTGGGFGGSTVNFVRRSAVKQFRDHLSRRYYEATNIVPTIRTTEIGEGGREEKV